MEHNSVKSPNHYVAGRKYEPKDVIRDWRLNFNLGSALKYIARADRKGDPVEDLEKAREYLAFEIDALKTEGKGGKVPVSKMIGAVHEAKQGCKNKVVDVGNLRSAFRGTIYEPIIEVAIDMILAVGWEMEDEE